MKAATRRIPLSRPYLGEREEELVLQVLRSGFLSLGPAIERFEESFAERVDARHAAAVSSGTAGLHLAVRLSGVGPGDEVITSPYSFVASANCAIYEGATPVFADIDPETLNVDPQAVEEAITERTKALVPVDIYGLPCAVDELRGVAQRHDLALVEDSCQALGAEYKGRPLGSHGHFAVFAFYPNKQMTTGEGGVVVTDSEEQASLLRSLRNQGRADTDGWLDHSRLGWNYRIDDLSAAVGIAQLEKLPLLLELRSQVAARYGELLAGVDGVEAPSAGDADHRRSWFVYVVKLARGTDRARLIAELEDEGIQSRPYMPCIHLQSYMRERYGFREGMFPVAEDASERTLALPFFPQLDAEDQERVAGALDAALQRR